MFFPGGGFIDLDGRLINRFQDFLRGFLVPPINFGHKEGLLPVCAALTASAESVAKEAVYDAPDF
jgi:hypothetical protein